MRNLQLKDICGYLPYGLIVPLNGNLYKIEEWRNDHLNNMIAKKVDAKGTLVFNFSHELIKPILRPMSNLTKEITHNGETFIPIIELAKISFPKSSIFHVNGNEVYCYNDHIDFDYVYFDKLSEWMFDFRGLINENLALAVTEEFNPYK